MSIIYRLILFLTILFLLNGCVLIGDECEFSSTANTKCPGTESVSVPKLHTAIVKANGSYDNKTYGKWYNTGIYINASEEVLIMTRGAVSTCAQWGVDTPIMIPLNAVSNSTSLLRAGGVHACDMISIWVNDPCPNVVGNNNCQSCNYASATANCNAVNMQQNPNSFMPTQDVNNTYNYPTCASDVSAYLPTGSDNSRACWRGFGYGLKIIIGNQVSNSIISYTNDENPVINNDGNTYYNIKIPYQTPYDTSLSLALDNDAKLGGYNVYLKSGSPCQTFNGIGVNDGKTIKENGYTGALQAIVVPTNQDPNLDTSAPIKENLLENINNAANINSTFKGCPAENEEYDNNDSQNMDLYGKNIAAISGTIWLKIADNDTSYVENTSQYKVYITTFPKQTVSMTEGINVILKEMQSTIIAIGKDVFVNIASKNSSLSTIIYSVLILYIVFVGMKFVMGLSQMNQMELVVHLLKIGLVMALVAPDSWTFFHDYFFYAFIKGSTDLIVMATGNECPNSDNPLGFLDKILTFFLQPATFRKISALLFTSPFGVLYLYLLFSGMYKIFEAVLGTIFAYIAAFFYIALLISLAPIFIIFILFEYTNSYFQKWVKTLMRSAFEPVLLIVGMAFLANVLVVVLNNIFDFGACFKCMLPISLPVGNGKAIPLLCIWGFLPAGYDNSGSGIMPTLFYKFDQVILFYIVAHVMKMYAELTLDISMAIFGSNSVGAANTGAKLGASFNQGMLSLVGRDDKTLQKQRAMQQMSQSYASARNDSAVDKKSPEKNSEGAKGDANAAPNPNAGPQTPAPPNPTQTSREM
jgi:type IV secretory pathway VirB6-like protein